MAVLFTPTKRSIFIVFDFDIFFPIFFYFVGKFLVKIGTININKIKIDINNKLKFDQQNDFVKKIMYKKCREFYLHHFCYLHFFFVT